MANTYKILGQVNTAVDTLTTLYTVPVATSTIISTLAVCNQANTASTYSIAIRPAGAAIDSRHYINNFIAKTAVIKFLSNIYPIYSFPR